MKPIYTIKHKKWYEKVRDTEKNFRKEFGKNLTKTFSPCSKIGKGNYRKSL